MTTALYPWQFKAWAQLQQLQGRWPHAILLHGPEGIGKTVLAEWLAQSLLCESPQDDGQACGACISCGWFSQNSHPDYRRLRPEALEAEDAESDSGDMTDKAEQKTASKSGKATKAPSKEIVINQVRNLADFMTLSTHRQGRRIIVIYPAQTMNVAAANALLKSLEEPGPNTVFILVARSVDSLLPTIVSRCRQFALTMPDNEQALQWLLQKKINHPEQYLAEQGGAPLAAYVASQSDTLEQQHDFLRYLQRPDVDGMLSMAEKLHKTTVSLVLSWMQRWLYDIFSYKLSGKIRYYPRYQQEIEAVAAVMSISGLLTLLKSNTQRRAVADHPLSAKLLMEEMLLEYSELIKSWE